MVVLLSVAVGLIAPWAAVGSASEQTQDGIFALSLEEILNLKVSTASKSAEKLSEAAGVVSVITRDELERFGGTTLKDVLERVPSLIGSTVYMTDRSTIAARGDQIQPSSSHVLLLIDGRPVREALEGGIKSEMFESFPINVIERIEVIRGPGSVLYGSNAFSAVINVITQRAEGNSLSATGLAGDSSAYGALAKGTARHGELGIVAAARLFKKADWETGFQFADPETGATVDNQLTIPNEGRSLFLRATYKKLTLTSAYADWDHSYFVADFASFGGAQWQKGFADLGYELDLNDKWKMDFNATYTRSTFEVDAWPDTNRDSYEFVGEWSNSVQPSEALRIVFGGLYYHMAGDEFVRAGEMEVTISDGNRSGFGAYAQADYRVKESLKLIGGFQANKIENLDLDVVPRGGLIWNPIPRLAVKAFYSQAFRAPSLNEIGLEPPGVLGNPDLKPEKVGTFDLGVGYQGEQGQVGVNVFHSTQKNIIFQDRSGAFPAPTYNNKAGEITLQGVEIEGKYYINREVFLTGSLLYQTGEDENGNENVAPIANLGAKAGVSYSTERGITASLFDVFQGGLDEFFDTELNPSPASYHMVSFHLKLNLVKLLNLKTRHGLAAVLQVDNLLDEEIWLPDWGLLPGKSMPVNPGRALYAGLSASLK